MSNMFVYFASLFSLAIFIIVRQTLMGQPAFRAEFVIEDLVLLLILAVALVPANIRPFAGRVVSCLMGAAIVAIVWTGMRNLTLPKAIAFTGVFTLLGVYSAGMAAKELSKLRRSGLKPPKRGDG